MISWLLLQKSSAGFANHSWIYLPAFSSLDPMISSNWRSWGLNIFAQDVCGWKSNCQLGLVLMVTVEVTSLCTAQLPMICLMSSWAISWVWAKLQWRFPWAWWGSKVHPQDAEAARTCCSWCCGGHCSTLSSSGCQGAASSSVFMIFFWQTQAMALL